MRRTTVLHYNLRLGAGPV